VSANPIEVVLKFEQAINSRKVDAIVAMCTDDSVFVDSIGSKVRGRDKLKNAWEGYLKVVPDYRISHEEIFGHGDTVAVFGSAGGTFAPDGKIVDKTPSRSKPEIGSFRAENTVTNQDGKLVVDGEATVIPPK